MPSLSICYIVGIFDFWLFFFHSCSLSPQLSPFFFFFSFFPFLFSQIFHVNSPIKKDVVESLCLSLSFIYIMLSCEQHRNRARTKGVSRLRAKKLQRRNSPGQNALDAYTKELFLFHFLNSFFRWIFRPCISRVFVCVYFSYPLLFWTFFLYFDAKKKKKKKTIF